MVRALYTICMAYLTYRVDHEYVHVLMAPESCSTYVNLILWYE